MSSKSRAYTEDSLKAALDSIRIEGNSIREASRKFGVPRTTLQDKLSGKIPEEISAPGPSTVLTSLEEEKVVEWCVNLTKCGFPINREVLLDTVQKIIKDDGRKTPFKDGRPGRAWFQLFLKRHPQIVQRVPEGITKGRAVITEASIRSWFKKLEDYLKQISAEHILNDPRRILNGDETGFSLCPKTGRVLALKGYRNVYEIKPGNEKDTITVLFTFNASGEVITPCVVFPYVRPPKDLINSVPSNWYLGLSDSGWMKGNVFFEYVANGLDKWLIDNKVQKPIIFFVDGHKSHLTLELSEYCHDNEIILYALPPNTTHIMQPADVSVFRPLKLEWRKTVSTWQRSTGSVENVTKLTFCSLLETTVLRMGTLPETIRNGFRKCGLYPFNPDAIDYTKCVRDFIDEEINPKENVPRNEDSDRYDIAAEVIKYIAPNLRLRNIDVDAVLEEIEKTKVVPSSAVDEYSVSDQTVLDALKDLEPGAYDFEMENLLDSSFQVCETSSAFPVTTNEANLAADRISESVSPIFISSPKNIQSSKASTSKNIAYFGLSKPSTSRLSSRSSTPSLQNILCSRKCFPNVNKHLSIPSSKHIFSKQKRKKGQKMPSAISSIDWRKIIVKKENEKEEKLKAIKNRKAARLMKKEQQELKKLKKQRKGIQKCAKCEDELISDVENDELKNIGCDKCPKWFHLKCTEFNNFEEAANSTFYCQDCLK